MKRLPLSKPRRTRTLRSLPVALAALGALSSLPAAADIRPSLSFQGVTGLLDMPSGEMQKDGTLSITSAHFGPISRTTLTFQILPRLSGSFRYTGVRNWDDVVPSKFETYYDRSFDVGYQLAYEGKYMPAITVGLMDVIGTGYQAGEYIAATKTFGGRLKVTAGLGWGRLGSYGAIGAPFGTRPTFDFENGGNLRRGQWFKGDMAPFAGVEWQLNDKIKLKAEYSSDAYALEAGSRQTFDRKSPYNFGLEYSFGERAKLTAAYMYGDTFGLSAQISLNPRRSPVGGTLGNAPPLVKERPGASGWSREWVSDQAAVSNLRDKVAKALAPQGFKLESMQLSATAVEIRIRVPKGENSAMVIGRSARLLSGVLPASVEHFHIVPIANGLPLARVSLKRSDMEQLDFAAGQDRLMRERVTIDAAGYNPAAEMVPGMYPKFTWGFAPYVKSALFDPDNPLRADFGIRLNTRYEIRPGLVFAGSLSKRLIGNMHKSERNETSKLPQVRSNSNKYDKFGDPTIDTLTLAWYAKPGRDIYTRVTVGYLERMYGGISGEVLWKPINSRLAIGAELNYVKQRDFNQLFSFQDYDVVTGHVSGYYTFNNGFTAQLDVGQYLAGDKGATLTIDREFANGWKVGAFATLTDVPFEDFGEGSFDKGIRIEIPFAWMTGMSTEKSSRQVIRPLLRDGGARLDVEGRLYETVRSYDGIRLDDQWGKFWR